VSGVEGRTVQENVVRDGQGAHRQLSSLNSGDGMRLARILLLNFVPRNGQSQQEGRNKKGVPGVCGAGPGTRKEDGGGKLTEEKKQRRLDG